MTKSCSSTKDSLGETDIPVIDELSCGLNPFDSGFSEIHYSADDFNLDLGANEELPVLDAIQDIPIEFDPLNIHDQEVAEYLGLDSKPKKANLFRRLESKGQINHNCYPVSEFNREEVPIVHFMFFSK